MGEWMELKEEQRDGLAEYVNIGFGRAAASLSMLLGQKIVLDAPEVQLFEARGLKMTFDNLVSGQLVIVHQSFNGILTGNVFLLMEVENVTVLVDLLSGGSGTTHRFSISDREVLTEVGNILLNAYIGSFGNLLKVQVRFSVPHLTIEPSESVLSRLDQADSKYLLLVKTKFQLLSGGVNGYVALVIGEDSLAKLIQRMEGG